MFQGSYTPGPRGLLGLKRINWSSLLNNTQKTLNIINQAIPIVYQVKPIINNAKTMFKVISAVKGDDISESNTSPIRKEEPIKEKNSNINQNYDNKPIFYI